MRYVTDPPPPPEEIFLNSYKRINKRTRAKMEIFKSCRSVLRVVAFRGIGRAKRNGAAITDDVQKTSTRVNKKKKIRLAL